MPKKKIEQSLFAENKKSTLVKRIIFLLPFFLGLALICLVIFAIVNNLSELAVFKLQKVFIEGKTLSLEGEEAFDYCQASKTDNLLDIDLEALRDRIMRLRPELKSIRIKKYYPDAIKVLVKEREPIAQIECREFFLTDEEAFILKMTLEEAQANLPIIIGVSSRHIKEGYFSQSSELKKAIEIIRLLSSTGFSRKYAITKVDVNNLDNLSFYIKEDVEVKLGKDEFLEKIRKIEARLPNLDLEQIRYIDLRFKDLIVGPK